MQPEQNITLLEEKVHLQLAKSKDYWKKKDDSFELEFA